MSDPVRDIYEARRLQKEGEDAYREGHLEAAERSYREGLTIFRRLAETHPEIDSGQGLVASALNDLGAVLRTLERLEEAEEVLQEALVIHRRLEESYPEVYRRALAVNLKNLSTLLGLLGRKGEAEDARQDALSIDPTVADQ